LFAEKENLMQLWFVWSLLFTNVFGLIGSVMVMYACVRRYAAGLGFNTIMIAAVITTILVLCLHMQLIASISVFLISMNPVWGEIIVLHGKGWLENYPNLNQTWCEIEAYTTFTLLYALMVCGLLCLYLPFAIFYHVEKNVDLPLLNPTIRSSIGIAVLTVAFPAILNTIRFLVNANSPFEENYQYSEWHCAVLPNDPVVYIWAVLTVICAFLSLWLSVATIKMVKNVNTTKRKGSKFKADEIVSRAFMFGAACVFVDFVACINLIGWLLYPEQGFFNNVPYLLWHLFSSLGIFMPLLLTTTQELLPFMPLWSQPFFHYIQSQIRKAIQPLVKEDSTDVASKRAPVISAAPPRPEVPREDLNPEASFQISAIPITIKLPK
jgi:hypothetical protein